MRAVLELRVWLAEWFQLAKPEDFRTRTTRLGATWRTKNARQRQSTIYRVLWVWWLKLILDREKSKCGDSISSSLWNLFGVCSSPFAHLQLWIGKPTFSEILRQKVKLIRLIILKGTSKSVPLELLVCPRFVHQSLAGIFLKWKSVPCQRFHGPDVSWAVKHFHFDLF